MNMTKTGLLQFRPEVLKTCIARLAHSRNMLDFYKSGHKQDLLATQPAEKNTSIRCMLVYSMLISSMLDEILMYVSALHFPYDKSDLNIRNGDRLRLQ